MEANLKINPVQSRALQLNLHFDWLSDSKKPLTYCQQRLSKSQGLERPEGLGKLTFINLPNPSSHITDWGLLKL
jgi:hypothetical protein